MVIGINLLGLVLLLTMLGLRVSRPGDGARIRPVASVWQVDGAVLSPWQRTNSIQEGDKVTAVNGVPFTDLVRHALSFQPVAPPASSAGIWAYTIERDGHESTIPVALQPFDFGAWLGDAWLVLLGCLVAQVVGAFVFIRRPYDRAARAALLWAPALWTSGALYSFGAQIGDFYNPAILWFYQISSHAGYVLVFIATIRFAMEFARPAGRIFELFRDDRMVWLTYIIPYSFVAIYLGTTWLLMVPEGRATAAASPVLWLTQWRVSTTWVGLAAIVIAVGVTLLSYRNTRNTATRLKIRWVVFTGCVVALLNLPLNIVPSLLQGGPVGSLNLIVILFVMFDVAIAFSILRYRYMDIDVLIRRTVVYGAMAVLLAAVYILGLILIGGVVLSPDNIGVLFGLSSHADVVASADVQLATDISIVLTTLLGVFSFDLLRRKLQVQVDRLFFRRRYNTEQAIAEFGAVIRREVDFDKLNSQLLELVQDSVQPQHVSLWTRPTSREERISSTSRSTTTSTTTSTISEAQL